MSDFRANIKAILDISEIDKQLGTISNSKIKLNNFTINTAGLAKSIQDAISGQKFTLNLSNVNTGSLSKSIASQMGSVGADAGHRFSSAFNSSLSSINTTTNNAANTIQHMQRTLASMKFDRSSIDLVTNDLEKMNLAISNVTTRIRGNNLNISIRGIDELGRAVTIVKQFDYQSGNISTTGKTIAQSFDTGAEAAKRFQKELNNVNSIKIKISNGEIDASISKITQKFNQLNTTVNNMGSGSKATELQGKLKSLETEFETLRNLQREFTEGGLSNGQLVSKYENFNNTLKRIQNTMTVVRSEAIEFASAMEVATLQNKMEAWLQNNSRASKAYGTQVRGYINTLKTLSSQGDVSKAKLNELSNSFRMVDQAAAAAGLKGKRFSDSLKGAIQSISRYVSASQLIYRAFRAIKDGIKNVIDLDTALVDLKKTTNATASELKEFYFSSNETAKSLGATTKDVIQAAADWSRLGYSLKDAQTMAEVSSIFASISPGMDMETATGGLVSAMKAFNIEADDALDGIASKINAIGNSQAVTNEDIVNFLTRSSSAMKEANNTLEQTIALGTAATEITRNAESVGTAMKTKFFQDCLYVQKCA